MASNQDSKVLAMLRRAGSHGVPNYRFPEARVLSYTKIISNLREDGHKILTERVRLKNGRYTNTYRYILVEGKISRFERLLMWLLQRPY